MSAITAKSLFTPSLLAFTVACSAQVGELAQLGDPAGHTGPGRYSMTFTAREDFAQGTMNGVTDDSEGQLQMTVGQSAFATPYLWTPDSSENSITLVDTVRNKVIGTWPLRDPVTNEPCYNPSRTTVDLNWDVWVGCRGTSSYINGRQGRSIQEVDNKVMKVSFRTGKVLLSVRVGNAPRALALDANNHLWVGASVDDTLWEIDGDTGRCYRGEGCPLPAIALPDFPYGAVVDADQRLWIVHNKLPTSDPDQVVRVNTATGVVEGIFGPFDRNGCTGLYGIAVDQLGDVWLGGQRCNDVVKLDGKTGAMVGAYKVGGTMTRGVAVDIDGNVWAASSETNTVTKLNGATGAVITTVLVGSAPIGVAVDAYGHLWAVNRGANSVTKVNGVTQTGAETKVGQGPYTYSDMLGLSLRTITLRKKTLATWRAEIDSQSDTARFTDVSWNVDVPLSTGFGVRVRCAPQRDALDEAAFGPVLSGPGPVSCAAGQRYLEVEARFSAVGTSASPVLRDLTVRWDG